MKKSPINYRNKNTKVFCLFIIFVLSGCSKGANNNYETSGNLSIEGYSLSQSVVLSRHNIRSPLSSPDSLLARLTPHQWFSWTSKPSELSIKGGLLEEEMGSYFKQLFSKEKLLDKYNKDEIRIYSNAKQRTIETSKHFVKTLFDSEDVEVELHASYDQMDPVFNPQFTFLNESYKEDVTKQINELYADKIKNLKSNYDLLCDVLDFDESIAKSSGEFSNFNVDDTLFTFELNKEPALSGSLKIGCSVADALVLQYYEENNDVKAAFNHDLSFKDWQNISYIKDLYQDVLFSTPLISSIVANPLLKEIKSEINSKHKFAYLCGHDSNLGSVLTSLDVNEYVLPNSLEKNTPIGSKIVFNTYLDKNSEAYFGISMLYQTAAMLKDIAKLDLDVHPYIVPLTFKGLETNKDGLYKKSDFLRHLENSIDKYNQIVEKYS